LRIFIGFPDAGWASRGGVARGQMRVLRRLEAAAGARGKEGTMQTKANEGNHFLQVLNQEIVEREHELEDCQRKLTILKDLRENYISASRRSEGQHRYRLTSDWRTATEATIAFLRGQSGPVPTIRILEHLKEVGIALCGSQPRNSLSVMLSRSRLFKAHGRRGWTLAED
jgi:hypothetical protein